MKHILTYLFIAMPLIGLAQTTLTLDDCVRLAKENNKKIEAAELQLLSSRQERHSTKALFFRPSH